MVEPEDIAIGLALFIAGIVLGVIWYYDSNMMTFLYVLQEGYQQLLAMAQAAN